MEFITTDQRIAVENFSIGRIYTITFKNSSSITRACIGKGADYVMFQETAPKMLFTLNMQTAATVDTIEPGTGTGTYDYDDLENKPQINSVTLSGNKSSSDLGLQDAISSEDPLPASYVSGLATVATSGAYSDLTGLPTLGTAAAAATTDFATAAQGSKADAADTAISTAATGYASLDARLDSMDTNISGKQAALTESQLDAVNSGIDSTKVAQIETNKTNILFSDRNKLPYTLTALKTYNSTGVWDGNSYTANNVTFTVNDDMSITVTASGTITLTDFKIGVVADLPIESGVTYWGDGNIPTYNDNYFGFAGISGISNVGLNNGRVLPTPLSNYTNIIIRISGALAAESLTFKPMIVKKSIYDSGVTDYIPYQNAELFEMIKALS